jgi:hypothetical protein
VRLRLLVVAAFAGMVLVPAVFVYATGVLPGPAQASALSTGVTSGAARAITSLAWPQEALGLASTDTQVLWEQRGPSPAGGLWSYDVASGLITPVLGRPDIGKAAGFPSAAADLVVWASWPRRRSAGPPAIQAYDAASARRWTVAWSGRDPVAAGDCVIWVKPDAQGANDAIRGINTLTDEQYTMIADGHVRDVAAYGSWLVWIARRGKTGAVWAGSYRGVARYRLAASGTAVAIDHDRIIWAAAGRDSSAILSWDQRSSRSTVLCRVPGAVSSLNLRGDHAAWVTTRGASDQLWAYDFGARRAYPVTGAGSRLASPVIVADTVYWADGRGGRWELYARPLQP